jgi:hypothetical protein
MKLLPDCMMPDGAEPCKAYSELYAELQRERTIARGLEFADANAKHKLESALGAAEARVRELEEALCRCAEERSDA